MRTWFAKQVNEAKTVAPPPAAELAAAPVTSPAGPKIRRAVYAPILVAEDSAQAGSGIRIKAKLDSEARQIVLMVDRPVVGGYSYWCASPTEAQERSPLANALFASGGIESVLIHEMNVTVTRASDMQQTEESDARRFGQTIRTHLEAKQPVMVDAYLSNMPSEDVIREGLQMAIDNEINPGIAGHSGEITLTVVKGNTAYIKMGGGCQGCAASSITLRRGVEQSFRAAVPELGALLDETDHAAGCNPFFTELPEGMRA